MLTRLIMIARLGLGTVLLLGLVACAAASGDGDDTGVGEPGVRGEPTASESSTTTPTPSASTPTATGPAFDPQFPDDKKQPAAPPADECIDKDDQGGSETLAKQLPATDDCDNNEKIVSGTMNGAVDVDFYKFNVSDKFGCLFQPHFEAKTAATEVCVFVSCGSGAATINSCAGGVAATSEIGLKGCCASGPANVTPDWDCPGFTDDDSAQLFVRVRQPSAKACLPYSWSYHF